MEIEEGTIVAEPQYQSLSDDRVKEIALALYKGQAFASWQIPSVEHNIVHLIFMPLGFMSPVGLLEFERDKIAHMIGFMEDAGPRSINGYPMFFSFVPLTQEDAERVVTRVKTIIEMMDQI